jgi:hypothetical protein
VADNTTGLPVQTLSGQFVSTKLVDTGGSNVASIDASGRLATNIGAYGGTATTLGQKAMSASMPVVLSSDQSSIAVTPTANSAINVAQYGGTNVVTGGVAGTVGVAGIVAHDAANTNVNPVLVGATASAAAPSDVSADNDVVRIWALRNGSPVVNLASGGTLVTIGQKAMASSVPVVIASDQSAIAVTPAANSAVNVAQYGGTSVVTGGVSGTVGVAGIVAHDAPHTNVNPLLGGASASAAAPTDVSADNDIVRLWALRNGSQVVNLAAGGTLWTNMGQAAASGQFVRLTDGTLTATVRDTGASDSLNVAIVDGSGNQITSFGGGTQYAGDAAATSTPTGTVAMGLANAAAPSDVSANNDAVAMWMLRNGSPVMNIASGGTLITAGQKAMSASLPVVIASDQTAVASNITQVSSATQSATNPLFVRLTDGTAAYSAGSVAPTDPKFSTQTSAALGAGASATLTHYVTSGKTGQLHGVDAGATVPLKIVINTVVTGTPTARVVLFTPPYETYQWRAPFDTYITRASADASSGFSVTITNKDASVAADVYSTAYWDEV